MAPSFLETPGAKEVGVELFSLSKSYNMTGWRAGAIVGNARPSTPTGASRPTSTRGCSAPCSAPRPRRSTVRRTACARCAPSTTRRRDLLVDALRAIGLDARPPKGTIYLWVPVPEGHTSASFTEQVLSQADVIVSPGAAYGPSGEGYVRFSLTVPDERLEEAVHRIAERVRL